MTLKISDFGMSKQMESYYTAEKAIPVRWAALEVLTHKKFSQASDVWAFGYFSSKFRWISDEFPVNFDEFSTNFWLKIRVTCWEIFETGVVPYGRMTNDEVYDAIIAGTRLTKPKNCSDEVWKLIHSCWEKKVNFLIVAWNFSQVIGFLSIIFRKNWKVCWRETKRIK